MLKWQNLMLCRSICFCCNRLWSRISRWDSSEETFRIESTHHLSNNRKRQSAAAAAAAADGPARRGNVGEVIVVDKAAGTPSPPLTDMEAAVPGQVRQTMVIAAVGLMPTSGMTTTGRREDENYAGATSVNGSKRRRQLTAARQLTQPLSASGQQQIRLEVQCDAPVQLL